jgi:hypothetical protein
MVKTPSNVRNFSLFLRVFIGPGTGPASYATTSFSLVVKRLEREADR